MKVCYQIISSFITTLKIRCAKAPSWQKCKNNWRYVNCNVISKKTGPASSGTDIKKENKTKKQVIPNHTLEYMWQTSQILWSLRLPKKKKFSSFLRIQRTASDIGSHWLQMAFRWTFGSVCRDSRAPILNPKEVTIFSIFSLSL